MLGITHTQITHFSSVCIWPSTQSLRESSHHRVNDNNNLYCFRVFKKGFHERPDKYNTEATSPAEDSCGSNTDWLSWIQPTIFHAGHKQ